MHLSARTRSRRPTAKLHLARVANTRSFVDAEQVRAWCGLPGTTVTVKPVVDLAEHLHVDQYQVPDRLAAPGHRARPDLCVPVVHPPRRGLRHWTT